MPTGDGEVAKILSDSEIREKMKSLKNNESLIAEFDTLMAQSQSYVSSKGQNTSVSYGGEVGHFYGGEYIYQDSKTFPSDTAGSVPGGGWRRVQVGTGVASNPYAPPPFAPASPPLIPPTQKSQCNDLGHTMRVHGQENVQAAFASCDRCGERAYIRELPLSLIRDQLVLLVKQIVGAEDEQALVSLAVELTIRANEADSLLKEISALRELVDEVSTSRKVA